MLSFVKSLSILMVFGVLSVYAQNGVIKNDFRVNNDSTGNQSYQPSVILNLDNSGIVVWRDSRNGASNTYSQAINTDGSMLGPNSKVSTFQGNYTELTPYADRHGDSILVSFPYGYGQWLTSNGGQLGSSFTLSFHKNLYGIDAVATDSGIFAVGNAYSGNVRNIYFRRFDLDGNPITDTMLVNDDGTSYAQMSPRIAKSKNGYIVAVWTDYRNANDADVYAQLFDKSGNKVGPNFRVNDTTSQSQDNPVIAMDTAGNFVIAWSDYRNGDKDIYAQRYNASGSPIGSNFMVNDDGTNVYQDYPAISMDEAGNFIVTWYDNRDGTYYIYGQMYDNAGNPSGTNFKISDNTGSQNQYDPSVYTNGSRFIVAWDDGRDDRSIYYRVFNTDGTPATADKKVNDISGIRNQDYPSIDVNSSGYGVITWYDTRYNSTGSILYSTFDTEGNIIDDNIYLGAGFENDVKIGEDSTIICVSDFSSVHIHYFIISNTGIDSANVEDNTTSSRFAPRVAIDNMNNFAVVWYDYRNGNADIYGQLFTNTGTPVGSNFLVNDDAGVNAQTYPDIAMAPSGKFLVTWCDNRNGNNDIYGQIYNPDGSKVGVDFVINDTTGNNANQFDPSVTYVNNGRFVVVWMDYQTPSGIYGRVFDTTGTFIGGEVMISDPYAGSPDIASSPDSNVVVTWSQNIYGQSDIYARLLHSDLTPIDTTYKVNNNVEGPNENQNLPAIALMDTFIYFTWKDPKWQHGYDIAAKVVTRRFLGIKETKTPFKASTFIANSLSSNFIKIKYTLLKPENVNIKLYDISGREIKLIKSDFSPAGTYKIMIPVVGLPHGVYFIRFKAGDTAQTSKFLLIK